MSGKRVSKRIPLEERLRRIDDNTLTIENPQGIDARLFAREDVPVEREGVEQLLDFLTLGDTLTEIGHAQESGRIAPFWGDRPGRMERVVLTPDFHKGGGIPIGTVVDAEGFVIPQAVGNDVCCGMRLLVTDLTRSQVAPHLDALERLLRGIFFEGQRDLPMSPRQREALLREGLWGLWENAQDTCGEGLWRHYDPASQERELSRVHLQGVLPAHGSFAFDDYIKAAGGRVSYDSQMGSVGGGNHFVEIQTIEEILDGGLAYAWGVKPDSIAIMVHSGSVGLGHLVGGFFREQARALYPKQLPHPSHGFYVLPTEGPHARVAAQYLDAMANAANFAFGNRLWLGLMAVRALTEAVGREVDASLVYDAPHNLIWADDPGDGHFLHRKGACPAYGPEIAKQGPFQHTGQPVIIPGSMGASSYLMAGRGHQGALCSACHGAGRSIPRGQARRVDDRQYQEALSSLRVVTPIDPQAHNVRSRRDILDKYHLHLKEEAPYAYKPVTAVVETVTQAKVAQPVARMWPLLTIKG